MNNQLYTVLAAVSLFTVAIVYSACKKKPPEPPEPTEICDSLSVSYAQDIAPLVSTYCSAPSLGDCHDGTTQDVPGLGNYSSLKTVVDNGTLEEQVFDLREMPNEDSNGPTELTPEDEQLLKCWLQDGALDN